MYNNNMIKSNVLNQANLFSCQTLLKEKIERLRNDLLKANEVHRRLELLGRLDSLQQVLLESFVLSEKENEEPKNYRSLIDE